ncbi:MAG: hypothetical protein FJ387_30785 [Verrucomicrobia bacterium]|nr:hypothetical protein [Verrucomicrobiota bacterium]
MDYKSGGRARSRLRALLWPLLALAAAILVGGAALIVTRLPRATVAPVTLPNGALLRARGVTYGTNHFAPGLFRFTRHIPMPLRRVLDSWIGPPSGGLSRRTTAEPKLMVWGDWSPLSPTGLAGGTSLRVYLEDRQGVLGGEPAWLSVAPNQPPGAVLDFANFPRRSPWFAAVIFQSNPDGSLVRIGQLRLPNPLPTHWPTWAAETLPARQENGDLTCTLESLQTGLGTGTTVRTTGDGRQSVTSHPAKPGEPPRSAIDLHFDQAGQPAPHWTLGKLELADATGNVAPTTSSSLSGRDRIHFHFGPSLWPDEPWELRLWAKRTPSAPFTPDETATLEGVAVPALGQTNRLDRILVCAGVQLHVSSFTLQPQPPANGYGSSDLSRIELTTTNLSPGVFIDLIRTIDNQGRQFVPCSTSTGTSPSGPHLYGWGFRDIPADAQMLEFTFAVQRGRYFAFRVQPEPASPNSAENR